MRKLSLAIILSLLLFSGYTYAVTLTGVADWAHWGLSTASDFNHKSGGNKISNLSIIGTGSIARFATSTTTFTWSDGTPTTSASSTPTGVYIVGLNNGLRFTVPAGTAQQRLEVFLAANNAQLEITAALSDSSAVNISNNTVNSTGSVTVFRKYTIDFAAGANNQTLAVNIKNILDNGGGNSFVAILAAKLYTTVEGSTPSPNNPPALVNPVNPMNYGALCNGSTNDRNAFQAAINSSDVLVPAGRTCVINGQVTISTSNRHIECGTGTILKQTTTGGSIFVIQANAGERLTGNSIANCSFLGTNTSPPTTDWNNSVKHWNIPILTRDRVDNFILVGNTFDRFYGQAMFQTNGNVDGGHGDQIVYNTFKNCGYYGPVFVAHANGYMAHNTMTDCSIGVENDDGGQVTGGNIIEYNTVGVIYGSGDGAMGASALLTGGCTGNLTNDIRNYSANIVRNNAISGVSNAQGAYPNAPSRLYICTKWLGSYAAQYSNNSCTNGCVVIP